MTRLIDADALLEAICAEDVLKVHQCIKLVRQAPTVQREGWVSVPIEPTYEMLWREEAPFSPWRNCPECGTQCGSSKNEQLKFYKAMLSAAPKE